MNADYWLKRWQENRIGFHQPAAHAQLIRYFSALQLAPMQRIFVPLCGKSHDIAWLLGQGLHVIGCELSALAIEQLFSESGVVPTVDKVNEHLSRYSSTNIDIFVGDIFYLHHEHLGRIDAVYDRAALVALPPEIRRRYARQLTALSECARQLLISFTYNQALMQGPPFSVPEAEIIGLYQENYRITRLSSTEMPRFKNTCFATEDVFLCSPLKKN